MLQDDFFLLDLFGKPIKDLIISHSYLIKVSFWSQSQISFLRGVHTLPFVESEVQVGLDRFATLFNEFQPIFEEPASMHILTPSIEHLRFGVELLVEVLEPSDDF